MRTTDATPRATSACKSTSTRWRSATSRSGCCRECPRPAIVAPFFLGLVADRYFATERVLGMLHLLGGLVMFAVPRAVGAPVVFILLLLLYNMCYMPTLGLANSLAFHHIQSQETQFPLIRVFGTIGWIIAG